MVSAGARETVHYVGRHPQGKARERGNYFGHEHLPTHEIAKVTAKPITIESHNMLHSFDRVAR